MDVDPQTPQVQNPSSDASTTLHKRRGDSGAVDEHGSWKSDKIRAVSGPSQVVLDQVCVLLYTFALLTFL